MISDAGDGGERIAPVTYLPGVVPVAEPAARRSTVTFAEEYWADEGEDEGERTADGGDHSGTADIAPDDDDPIAREEVIRGASASLTRSLGRRGLSIAEARGKLRATDLTAEESAEMIDEFLRRGWLDDAALAEQIVHSSTTRKDMGSKAIRQLLQKRLVAREVIDAVAEELPDDDAERALEFATTKARSLTRYDDETAIRRLMGMLARRGFGGSIAGTAARSAMASARRESGGGGVRFR